MSVFTHVETITGTPHSEGLSSLAIHFVDGEPFLFTSSEITGGLASYSIGPSTDFVDRIGFGVNRGTMGVSDIDMVDVDGQLILVPSGRIDDRLAFHKIDGAGDFDGLSILGASTALIGNIEETVTFVVDGKTFMVSSQWGQSGFQTYRIRDDLSVEHIRTWEDTNDTFVGDITSMTSDTIDGRTYFFAASAQDTGVSSYWMGRWGNVKERGSIGVEDGFYASAPSALATATVGGKLYLIVGSAGSNSLTVMRVNDWGDLFIESHLLDTLDTRFGGVTSLESFAVGNRSFLLAGGADDGVSLFEINPDGSLTHIETIADQNDTTLMNVTTIAATVIESEVHVFVAGTDAGFTEFTIDLGNLNDLKSGTDGNDTINGNGGNDLLFGRDGNDSLDGRGGDDRLMDGAGVDEMTGGSGADVFVFSKDGRMDTITDFEDGTDLIDLSAFDMLYTFEQLNLIQKGYGVLLQFGNERVRIEADAGQLLVADLSAEDFLF